jgi:hypothetical protein
MSRKWFAWVLAAALVGGLSTSAEAAAPSKGASATPNPARHPIQHMEHKQKVKKHQKAAHKGGGGGHAKAVGPKPNPLRHPIQASKHKRTVKKEQEQKRK